MKKFTFRNKKMSIERRGYGTYVLNGYHYTDSSVYDNVDSDNKKESLEARKTAYLWLKEKY